MIRKKEKFEGGTMDPRVKELHLLLIYMTGWEEESRKEPEKIVYRAWRGYSFETLNELERERLIRQYSNSVILTNEGKAKAQGLSQKYFQSQPPMKNHPL
jgi:hypothetical protein